MKTLSLESKDLSLDTLVETAARGNVIVTQDNEPLFAVIPVGQDDLQTWQLGEGPGIPGVGGSTLAGSGMRDKGRSKKR